MIRSCRFLALGLAFALSQVQGTELAERVPELFQIEAAFIPERGTWEAYSAVELQRSPGGRAWDATSRVGLELGVADRLAVDLTVPWRHARSDSGSRGGLGDVGVQLIRDLSGERSPVALLVAYEVTAPTGSADGDDKHLTHEIVLIAARSFGGAQWHVNVGGERTSDESAFVFGASVLMETAAWLIPSIELAGSLGRGESELYLTPGLHWQLADELFLGAAVPIGLGADSQNVAVLATVSMAF